MSYHSTILLVPEQRIRTSKRAYRKQLEDVLSIVTLVVAIKEGIAHPLQPLVRVVVVVLTIVRVRREREKGNETKVISVAVARIGATQDIILLSAQALIIKMVSS